MTEEKPKIGDYLQRIRKEKKIELEDIARETKININLLKLLEESNLSELPGKTYVKGFVTNYLKYLKEDTREGLEILNTNYQNLNEPTAIVVPPSEAITEASQAKQFSIDSIFNKKNFSFVLIALLLFGLYRLIDHLANRPKVIKNAPPVELEQDSLPSESSKEALVSSTSTTTTLATTTTIPSSRYPFIKFNKISRPYYDIEGEEVLEEIPEKYHRPSSDTNSLYVRATFGKCWLRYKVDDNRVKSFTLKEGQELFLTGDIFFFNFGSVGSLEIFYNNRRVNAPSDTGFKLLILPIEEAKSHFYPLFVDDATGVPHFYQKYQELMDKESAADTGKQQ